MDYFTIDEEMVKKAQSGDKEAIEFIIINCSALIGKILKTRKANNYYSYEDLYQEGVLAIYNAIKNYNVDLKNASFTTYCYVSIASNINYFMKKNNGIFGNNRTLIERRKEIKTVEENFYKEKHRLPNKEELSEELFKEYNYGMNGFLFDTSLINLKNIQLDAVSAGSQRNGDCEDSSTADIIKSNTRTPEEEFLIKENVEILLNIIDTKLEEEEKYIINHFFGINGNEKLNQTTIAKHLNASQVYVSKKIQKILQQLKKELKKEDINYSNALA